MELWSWTLTAFGIFGLWTAGSGKSWGWLVGLAIQIPWLIFALTTGQYGFIIGSVAYGIMYARNYLRARREKMAVCGGTYLVKITNEDRGTEYSRFFQLIHDAARFIEIRKKIPGDVVSLTTTDESVSMI